MTRKFSILFSIVALCVFFLSVCYFVGSMIIESSKGSRRAEEHFASASREIVSASSMYTFMDSNFVSYIDSMLRGNPSVAAVTLTGPEGAEYAWPLSSPYISRDGFGNPRISTSSPLVKITSGPLDIYDVRNVTLTTAVYTLPLETIYYHGRNAFLIILAFTLLAVIFLIADKLDSTEEEPADKSAAPSRPAGTQPTAQDEYTPPPVREHSREKSHPEDASSEEEKSSASPESEPGADGKSPAVPKQTDPAGLFSPETGMGWESYLEVRLDAELSRAASAEEDTALVIIELPDIRRGDAVSRAVAQNMLHYFKFRDFIFEYGATGFAGILQNENLDRAMTIAEELYNDINETLKEHTVSSRVAIGISTRIFRLIPGSRLIEEAKQAVKKAFDETTLPIVAFRANPEKYREYIAEKMQKHGQPVV
ncbi:MAG: hypothetical protein LBR47_04930 [Spirochaetaceae bacterium]|jgi:GGDEF domain-containing protein|nr:hypothetical protein [Spirochaetaceae bacterium]